MSRTRSKARRCAMQALYQWQMAGQDLAVIERDFLEEPANDKMEVPYFRILLHEVPKHVADLDENLGFFIDRAINKLDPVERAILRIGAYELMFCLDVPYRVAINEGVELAKIFGADKSHKYINGVLDKLAHKVRSTEIGQAKKSPYRGA